MNINSLIIYILAFSVQGQLKTIHSIPNNKSFKQSEVTQIIGYMIGSILVLLALGFMGLQCYIRASRRLHLVFNHIRITNQQKLYELQTTERYVSASNQSITNLMLSNEYILGVQVLVQHQLNSQSKQTLKDLKGIMNINTTQVRLPIQRIRKQFLKDYRFWVNSNGFNLIYKFFVSYTFVIQCLIILQNIKIEMQKIIKCVIDPFCFKQFIKTGDSLSQIQCSMEEFQEKINSIYDSAKLKDGYAPFCKHIFVENWTQNQNSTQEITEDNCNLLKTEYEARTEKELPVLVRYFPSNSLTNVKKANFYDVILYSKDQIQQENLALGNTDPNADVDYEYGIISIKPQAVDFEIPMNPITMMRNSLGKQEGGSGVPLDRKKYLESVEFWSKNALIK